MKNKKNTILLQFFLLSLLLLLISCTPNDEIPTTTATDESVNEQHTPEEITLPTTDNEPVEIEEEVEKVGEIINNDSDIIVHDEVHTPTNPSATVETIADEIIIALDNQDMATIDMYVHPEKGLLFSPYINIKPDAIVIPKQDIPTLLSNTNTFVWGTYDGIGTPISLTPANYFTEFLDMSLFIQPDDKFVNQFPGQRGNMINNLIDVFPESVPVDYFHEGTDQYSGMDWESVILIFLQDEAADYYLIAIVRDMWTI